MSEKEIFQFESEEINIKEVLQKYLKYWYLFVLSVITAGAVAFVYLRYTTPQYRVSSTLLIKDDKKGPSLADNVVLDDLNLFQSGKNIDNEIEILKSKSLMNRVLQELSLNTTYYVDGRVKSTEIYGATIPLKVIVSKLDSSAFNKAIVIQPKDHNEFQIEADGALSQHKFGAQIKTLYGVFTVVAGTGKAVKDKKVTVKFHDIRKVAESYNQKLTVAPVNKNASVLSLSLVDPVPAKGVAILNKLVEVYNKEAVEDKNLIAGSTIQFIDERLKYLTSELSLVEEDVESYKKDNRVTDVSSEAKLYLEKASDYNRQLSEWAIQIDVLESIERYLLKQESEYELVPSTLTIQDPTLLGLISKFNELQLERNRLLRVSQSGNPLVQNINEQLGNLRSNILENLRNIKDGLKITRSNLQASSAQFESRIKEVPSIEKDLIEIKRQQSIKEGLYLYLLQKREESALSLAATVANSRIIDPAISGDTPVEPKKQLIYLLAFLVGLGIPFAGIYIKELLNDRVQSQQDVKKATNTPILGEIAHNDTFEKLVVTENSRSTVAELFRLIRTNLQFATLGKDNKVIMVTSSMSGEGKTFFTINLGASLALTGKRVVLVNFDLRKPRLLQDMDLSNEIGITNYIIDEQLNIQDILIPSPEVTGLYAIGSGPIPPNPAELMMSPKVGHLLAELREQFDYILLDTSPAGQVADAFTLAPLIDASVYIVRYNYTFKSQVAIVDDIYQNKKLNHPMIVLNDAEMKEAYGYGYGYGYNEFGKPSLKNTLKKGMRIEV
ncbi:polysaccharide biosynthesis tyrosine autokinase [Pontibacter sp. BT310]|uniref:non-specific protein-tyrosine kinase n=1 Tax=Pontibacter populi TaxID=890055 RepID=A0ABS6XDH0_9BACT|nr:MULTISPECIES: tyrosine-protein kinase [Pontibacter]MBJ6119198.1 polysaccharide biosynthesis tyrosine autokinase [Pontibacter sp. BT310]MBR0571626.1 polysaccharide biosynthesis tyrosine autokinase [Microvirga sp. STS03]MBW3366052.1 polysaccharide biosynthesis tyrosine autokinase [Pontibacter populi]